MSDLSRLPERSVIRVGGDDRLRFLDGLLSCQVAALSQGALAYGALLSPQGKILCDMMVFVDDETVALDVPESARDDLMRRLTLYKLRAAVSLEATDEAVAVTFAADPAARPDPRGKGLGGRRIAPADTPVVPDILERYAAARIAAGVPDAVVDFALGDAFPHDVNMDLTGGVDFKKGCFVGQEVVSRMRHRGTARRRTVIVASEAPLPETGSEILADGRPAGRLGTRLAREGLATVRIDRVGAHADAAGVPIALRVPEGAPFSLAEA